MLNQLVIVGRLVKEPEVKETENGNKKGEKLERKKEKANNNKGKKCC